MDGFALKVYTFSEQSVELGIDLINDLAEMFLVLGEVVIVSLEDEQPSKLICFYPCLISLIKPLKVIEPDGAFVLSSAFLYLVDKCRD